jgi:hypothetical protein
LGDYLYPRKQQRRRRRSHGLSQLSDEQGILIRAAGFYLRCDSTTGNNSRIFRFIIIDNDDQKEDELRWQLISN